MSRFSNPKTAQAMMETHGHTNIGMPPKPGFPGAAAPVRPGVKPTVTGAPDKNLPFIINNKPALMPMAGTRPGVTTGGPKPAPAPVQAPASINGLGSRFRRAIAANSAPAPATAGTSPLDGLKNLPKMSGPLGKVGTTGGQNLPPGIGLGGAFSKNSGINTTTTADMMGSKNPAVRPTTQNVMKNLGSLGAKVGAAAPQKMGGPNGMKKGGKVSSASKRADGIAVKGKTRGRIV